MFFVLLGLLLLQRLLELRLAARNARWLRARGAVEAGASHYPAIVALHVAFFIFLTVEVVLLNRTPAPWWPAPFAVFLLAQGLRYWTIATLGRRWNTRILVLPDEPPVASGPFRFLSHPNYLAVALELLTIPLIFQAYVTATLFTLLNAAMMLVRIPAEQRALGR